MSSLVVDVPGFDFGFPFPFLFCIPDVLGPGWKGEQEGFNLEVLEVPVVVVEGPLEAGTYSTACLLTMTGGAPGGEVLVEEMLIVEYVTGVHTDTLKGVSPETSL